MANYYPVVNPGALEGHTSSVKSKSENLIKTIIPQKIEQLDKLLASDQFSFKHQGPLVNRAVVLPTTRTYPGSDSKCQTNSTSDRESSKKKKNDSDEEQCVLRMKCLAVSSDPVPINPVISNLMDTVKPHIRDLVEHAALLKMWVTFLMPTVEDGNNFGVSIQESVVKDMRDIEYAAAGYYYIVENYYSERAKVISKVLKYPEIDDYRKAVSEMDERKLFSVRDVVADVRNHYATMHELIVKNWDKILVPRSSNAENMY